MKTKLTLYTLIAFLLPVSGYANNSIGEYFAKKFLSGGHYSNQQDGPAARMECANFSGQWKMKCTTTSSQGNATSDLTMGISQKDCLAIKSGDDAAYFGGMASRTDFIPSNEFAEVHSTVGYSYEWVDQKSSFQVKLGGLMKITSNTAPSAPKVTTSTISGKFLYTLAGNQLKVAGTFLTTDYPVFEMNCVGERQ